jgi:hypothetical protein
MSMGIFSSIFEQYLKDQLEDLKLFLVKALALYGTPSDPKVIIRWVETAMKFVCEHGTPTDADVKAHLGTE